LCFFFWIGIGIWIIFRTDIQKGLGNKVDYEPTFSSRDDVVNSFHRVFFIFTFSDLRASYLNVAATAGDEDAVEYVAKTFRDWMENGTA